MMQFALMLLSLWVALPTFKPDQGPAEPKIPHSNAQERVGVGKFGTTGDGRTNDTEAFRRALEALQKNGGGVLTVDSGTYVIGDLEIPSETALRGAGSPVLLMAAGANSLLSISGKDDAVAHDIEITSITLRGRSVADGFSEHKHLLNVNGAARVKISGVSFESFQGDGAYFASGSERKLRLHNSDIWITGSRFDGVNQQNRNGISFVDCQRCLVERNSFTRISRSNMPGAIDLEPDWIYERVNSILIRNNSFESIAGSVGAIALALGPRTFDVLPGEVTIDHNSVQNSTNGIAIVWRSNPDMSDGRAMNVIVSNNTEQNVDHPLVLDGVVGIRILTNTFTLSEHEIMVGGGRGVSDVDFEGNKFSEVGLKSGHQVEVGGELDNIQFQRNWFVSAGRPGQHGGVAVYFAHGVSHNVSFVGNVFSCVESRTELATQTTSSFRFDRTTKWQNNMLQNGIRIGDFPGR